MCDAERSHHLSLIALKNINKSSLLPNKHYHKPKNIFGIEFENPVGLAAGLDKDGEYIDALGKLGFGFLEIGTVTPKPQPGNPKPRLFRLKKNQAIINRMGFNNKGIDALIGNVKRSKYEGVLGINIGKNATTPIESAHLDYQLCLEKAYCHADYIVINISSPNTPGLRDLQFEDAFKTLFDCLKQTQHSLATKHQKQVPLLVKVAPDLLTSDIKSLAQLFSHYNIEGVIATNTTIQREHLITEENMDQKGGLSGKPLLKNANDVLKELHQCIPNIPLIGVGGIMNAADAQSKFDAGASLVQLYSGLIYNGPKLIGECVNGYQNV